MSVSRQNLFPGMNLFLQRHWPDVHLKLINDISNALSCELPEDLLRHVDTIQIVMVWFVLNKSLEES